MIGLMLITHGRLGDVLLETLVHVVGPQTQVGVVGVADDDDPAMLRPAAERLLQRLDTGDGVLVLTDIFGSSPSNLALSLREPGHVEVVSGVNVPMLVKLAKTRRDLDLAGCVEKATMAGRKYIAVASQLPAPCLHGGPRACTLPVH
ncbi:MULTISPECIES: PTS sugar transporter subunit IIA [Gluconobacter]|uniref:PTS fructose transporter subunit IIA n=2 Tax=Gluconobacter albidus TaxID=318683 RepID=A0A149SZZ7_9PROT|nr:MULTISPECIES: PTS sugar transporter subunit IIA [Gluconobacter]KXV37364.1 PTS sugar transporter subunit IIB [Gluconobacter albidus]KXV48627.1 PTS sugar transporter subunit IIB [Gluconobacter albidus]MBS1028227.1 PTS sugar transporter subunit IIA [Gluconobacter albidus]MCP1273026.1 PTS sugar transporter subunit IIA [Gluconobacter albidus]OUI81594.1 PTS sugar transporter subunit IIB [Gluconobacter sp. DsW_056]